MYPYANLYGIPDNIVGTAVDYFKYPNLIRPFLRYPSGEEIASFYQQPTLPAAVSPEPVFAPPPTPEPPQNQSVYPPSTPTTQQPSVYPPTTPTTPTTPSAPLTSVTSLAPTYPIHPGPQPPPAQAPTTPYPQPNLSPSLNSAMNTYRAKSPHAYYGPAAAGQTLLSSVTSLAPQQSRIGNRRGTWGADGYSWA